MRLLVVTCPIAQIFQERYHDRLIENPQQIYQEEYEYGGKKQKPQIIVPTTSMGPISFNLGQPFPIGGKKGTDKSLDILAIAAWLSGGEDGGRNNETDCYGIADLGLDDDAASSMVEALMVAGMSGKKANFSALGSDIQARMKASMKRAEMISKERIMRQVRDIHNNYEAQKRACDSNNQSYQPSKVEWLCRFVLKAEIQEREARQESFKKNFEEPLTTAFEGAPANG